MLRRGVVVVAGFALLVVGGAVLAIVLGRIAVQRGIDRTQDALDAARRGDGERAAELFDEAERAFRDARGDVGGLLVRPARNLPVVGEHLASLETLAQVSADLAGTAATAARAAGIDDLAISGGRIDLEHLRSMADPLADVRAALDHAQEEVASAAAPWLAPPVRDRVRELEDIIDRAVADTETAALAVEILPSLLGEDEPRYYFVAFGTPAESRELGGFMGAYAILVADDGQLELGVTGRVRDLNRAFERKVLPEGIDLPATYRAFQPQRFWHNLTSTPDFPTMAGALRQLWPSRRLGDLDGALYLDPDALASLLELTGPVSVPDLATPLTSETARDFLVREQYVQFPDDDRHDFLLQTGRTVFRELTSGTLPEAALFVEALLPSVHERRLMVNSFHPEEQELIERLHLDGSLPPVQGDFVSVRASNRGLNKIDALMRRSIRYAVELDPGTGEVQATLSIRVANDAPSKGLPDSVIGNRAGAPQGTNSTLVAVYTPLDLVDVTVAGRPVGRSANPEYGRNRYTVHLDVPPGEASTVVFELEGSMDLTDGYHLDVVPQPLVESDRWRIDIDAGDRWRAIEEDEMPTDLREVETLDVRFVRVADG